MGCIPYQTVRDATACLHRNVILYKGLPHLVFELTGPPGICAPSVITLRLTTLPTTQSSTIFDVHLDDPDLNVNSLRLGFVNDDYDALWCARYPHRGNAQGLTEANVAIMNITKFGNEPRRGFSRVSNSKAFTEQFTGKYPTVKDILSEFEKTPDLRSRAFSLRFAISRDSFRGDYLIHHRTEPVAFGNIPRGEVNMAKGFQFLKEQFQEFGFNVVG